MATQEPEATPAAPTKVCPNCGVQSQTTSDKCPSCGKGYKQKKKGGCLKWLGIIALLLIAIGVISALAGGGDDEPTGGEATTTEAAEGQTTQEEDEESGDKTGPVVRGTWNGDCNQFSAGDESACAALKASDVTCQWVNDKVKMKVTFTNGLAAHVTVHLEPKYTLKDAGAHGEGFTNVEDVGIDAKATREWETELDPAGIEDAQPAITECNPTLDVLQGVELG